MSEDIIGSNQPPPKFQGFGGESAGYVPPSPQKVTTSGGTQTPPSSQDTLTPEDIEFQKAMAIVAEYEGKSFDELPTDADRARLSENIAIVVKYTNTQSMYETVINPNNPYTDPKAVSIALGGKIFDVNVLTSLRLNRPILPPPPLTSSSTSVPSDIAGNEWFSGNALLNLRLAAMDLAKTNRDAALKLGLMEAFLMTTYKETQQEVAELTKKTYDKQAEQAMWEMIGSSVSLAVTTASMATTVAGAGVGFAKGFAKGPSTVDADGAPVSGTRSWSAGLKGAGSGAAATGLVTQQMSQAGGSAGQIISSLGRMLTAKDLGELERSKVLAQAAADLTKKAMESCNEESKAALEHNDQLRAFLKASDDERVRIFGSITAHG